jgi:hypothetical protein
MYEHLRSLTSIKVVTSPILNDSSSNDGALKPA